jgi:putative ABC transport system permease protein
MGASMTSGLLTVSNGIEEKLALEFRKFGSNILLVPKSDTIEVGFPGMSFGSVTEQRYIDESDLWKVKKIDNWSENVLGFAPFLYQVVQIEHDGNSQNVVLAGTYFNQEFPDLIIGDEPWITGIKKIAPYWSLEGSWIDDNDNKSLIAGVSVAEKLNLELGQLITLSYENPETREKITEQFTVAGIVSTGGAEDSQLFVTLPIAQKLSNRPGKVHSVQVSALCIACPAELMGEEIEKKLPYVQAKTVKHLVRTEMLIMNQLGRMMLLITIVALAASGMGIMTTTMTTVIERRKEIGLMKSIGAENSKIAAIFLAIFLAESLVIGTIGGLSGYLLGNVLAQYIGETVFGTPITPILFILPLTIGISLLITVLASALPVRRATMVEPAIVLKGE